MITSNIQNLSSMSTVKAKVDLYNHNTLVKTCTCGEVLENFTITREGESNKFFGFGICQKLDVYLIDIERNLTVQKGYEAKIGLGDGGEIWDTPYPVFYIKDVKRDERSNTITCTAYDKLYEANKYTLNDLYLRAPYTIRDVATAIASKLDLILHIEQDYNGNTSGAFDLSYEEGANFDGTEDLRSVLNGIAEATQTIYFVQNDNEATSSMNYLCFKRLDPNSQPYRITKNDYYELNTLTPVTLRSICNVTELGENVKAGSGTTQYIRNNPFLELREDLGTIIDNAVADLGGLTITPFDCEWVGNYLLEVGDRIALTVEDDSVMYSYLLSDTIVYSGALEESTEWIYSGEQEETPSNSTNLGEKLNATFARVDKVNQEITLLAAETDSRFSSLQVTTDGINATVSALEDEVTQNLDSLNYDMQTLAKEVSLKVDADAVTIEVERALSEGVDHVITAAKKYSFDDEGLNISDSDSEISTRVTEDGMRIYRNTTEVLSADNMGVRATDLHAKTYLIIGEYSRLENWNNSRTACFWIGPAGG